MKNLIIFITTFVLFTSCSVPKEGTTSGVEKRQTQRLVTAGLVMNAVESRKFIVKLDRLYPRGGGIVELRPRSNYIVIDGNVASVRAAYFGRQYDLRIIEGIRLAARTEEYSINKNVDKQQYKISLKITSGGDTFDVFLDITNTGKCYATISSLKIDQMSYSGELVPISNIKPEESSERSVI
jgi:hypothetical protein